MGDIQYHLKSENSAKFKFLGYDKSGRMITGSGRTMKINYRVKISLLCLMGFGLSGMLTNCAEPPPPTFFGTGSYYCFCQNLKTGKFYKGVETDQKKAIQMAAKTCWNAEPSVDYQQICQFDECVFK
ncbi:MAG: hypothetical protein NTU49_04250 [Gammaproteobacteria bacterium]|nr:hypothetical protein [Gammaproteobacteria bacterium]